VTVGLLLRGVALGFAVAFALGPVGLLVIRRTIDRGFRYGFASGLGVASADALYGAIAAFGVTAITELLMGIERPLAIVGGLVLVLLALRGVRSILAGAASLPRSERPGGIGRLETLTGAWASMVGLTLTNPATILSFAALFASIGAGTGGPAGAAAVTVGVFAGSAAWWVILTGAVSGLRARLTPSVVRGLNVLSAAVIAAFGVVAIAVGVLGRGV
jgi:threonine/homoserine/homoserine lactone efflux protein